MASNLLIYCLQDSQTSSDAAINCRSLSRPKISTLFFVFSHAKTTPTLSTEAPVTSSEKKNIQLLDHKLENHWIFKSDPRAKQEEQKILKLLRKAKWKPANGVWTLWTCCEMLDNIAVMGKPKCAKPNLLRLLSPADITGVNWCKSNQPRVERKRPVIVQVSIVHTGNNEKQSVTSLHFSCAPAFCCGVQSWAETLQPTDSNLSGNQSVTANMSSIPTGPGPKCS